MVEHGKEGGASMERKHQAQRQPATYYHVKGCGTRIQVHQGGTRSGKTYSILQALIEWCYLHQNWGWWITIVRKTFPSLRSTAMRDFIEILQREGYYREKDHHRTEHWYSLFGNKIEFIGVDQPAKIRGRKRNILFANEADQLTIEDWRQLVVRTTDRIIIDYNPSDEFHWIYDQVIPRDDATFFKTTYLDNPFLDQATIDEIERLKDVDENFWRVYGLGERGMSRATIFTHWKEVADVPQGFKLANYGLDFGYSADPTSIVAVYTDGNGFCFDEIAYANNMSNADIGRILNQRNPDRVMVVADSAEPKSIQEIRGYGQNIVASQKGADSVRSGIQFLQGKPMYITGRSTNMVKEIRNYKWQEDRNGKVLNVPVDANNHTIDAARYAATFNRLRPNFGKYVLG
jgi:phage terminase large subunit